jgi:lipopolysaccharide transport system ATP-binding protein
VSEPVITVAGLGKQYRIRHAQSSQPYVTLRDTIADAVAAPLRMWRNGHARRSDAVEEFWALRDVTFEVQQGAVIGIIGRNGAGKSTLLKILSRITEPTEGRAVLRGRAGSLLEVGTGFHPELSGRDNIFLNASILGMSRAEVERKFDEIVAFAGTERFLDTPVKRYSSGMAVRLAFAVAAHLEPEILIVDEVLAVGDAEFQQRCLGKMGEVARSGRTVLFVSHQMAAVQNLCTEALLLSGGRIKTRGTVADVIHDYLSGSPELLDLSAVTHRQGTGAIRFTGVTMKDATGRPVSGLTCGAAAVIEVALSSSVSQVLRNVRIGVGVEDHMGYRVATLSTHLSGADIPELSPGAHAIALMLPRVMLAPGRYGLTLYVSANGETSDWLTNAGAFWVDAGDFYGTGQMPQSGPRQGVVLFDHQFTVLK